MGRTGRRRVVGRVDPKTISPPDSEVLCPRVARFSSVSGRTAGLCNPSRRTSSHILMLGEWSSHVICHLRWRRGGARRLDEGPQERGALGRRALGFTDLQISKDEVIVRHIGKNATVLYEFKKPVDIMERS